MQWFMPAIAGFAEQAGFHGDRLARAVALAWASSAGDDGFHWSTGDPPTVDERGLWAVDLVAFPTYQHRDLFDPRQSARIAYTLTQATGDTFDWSTVHREGLDTRWLSDARDVVASGQRGDRAQLAPGGSAARRAAGAAISNRPGLLPTSTIR